MQAVSLNTISLETFQDQQQKFPQKFQGNGKLGPVSDICLGFVEEQSFFLYWSHRVIKNLFILFSQQAFKTFLFHVYIFSRPCWSRHEMFPKGCKETSSFSFYFH